MGGWVASKRSGQKGRGGGPRFSFTCKSGPASHWHCSGGMGRKLYLFASTCGCCNLPRKTQPRGRHGYFWPLARRLASAWRSPVGMVAGGNLGSPPIYMDGMGVGVTSGVGDPRHESGWKSRAGVPCFPLRRMGARRRRPSSCIAADDMHAWWSARTVFFSRNSRLTTRRRRNQQAWFIISAEHRL